MADTVRTLRVELTGGSAGLQKSLKDAAAAAGRMGVEVGAVQGKLNLITAARPAGEMKALELAVRGLGGTASLSGGQLSRLKVEVNALAAAGAKVPASLAGLTGMGSKLGAAFTSLTTGGGVTGALAALGPAGLAAAGAIGAVTIAGGAAVREISSLAQSAEEWTNVSAATGLGVESVQRLRDYLEDAGFSADALGTMMKRLQKEITNGGKEFEKYGISLEAIRNLAPEEQLRAVAQAVTSIIDPTVRAAAAQEFFGKSGAEHLGALQGIASGAYLELAALTGKQVEELKRVDDQLDQAARTWTNWKKVALTSAAEVFNFLTKPVLIGGGEVRAGGVGGLAGGFAELDRITNPATYLDTTGLTLGPQEEETRKRAAEAQAAAKKSAEELLAVRKKYNELQVSIVKATSDEASLLRDLDEQSKTLLANQDKQAAENLSALKETRLRGGDMLPSVGGAGLWTRYQDVLDQEMENAGAQAEEAAAKTKDWGDTLNTLANQLSNLAQSTGGFAGKLLGIASSLSSGAGGVLSGIQGFKDAKGGGLMGFLGKFSSSLGIVGSAIGAVGGLIGGIKSLFGGKSKEQKAAEAAAKKQAEDDAKAAKIEKAQKQQAAGEQAKGFAEALSEKLAAGGLSEKLTGALAVFVGKMGEALGKLGIGLVDARLKDSQSYQAASGVAGDVAGAMGAARQAGIVDEGLTAAASGAAAAIQEQAIAAAREAGLSDMEAAKQGSLAIASILREQLNASIQSGQDLDANTQALIAEAQKNGISILADPAIESLGVQREQLGVLQQIAGQRPGSGTTAPAGPPQSGDVPAARGFGPMITPNLGRGLGPRIQTHAGEFAHVVPRSKVGSMPSFRLGGIGDFGRGSVAMLHGREAIIPLDRMGRGGFSGGTTIIQNLAVNENPLQTYEGVRRQRAFTVKEFHREASRSLASAVAAGGA